MATRQLAIIVLITSSLSGMDQFKEQLLQYLARARTCNPEQIRSIPAQTLKDHPVEFFNTALSCPNFDQVLQEFDSKIKNDQSVVKSNFAHFVNNATHKSGIKKNYFLEKLIEQGKYR